MIKKRYCIDAYAWIEYLSGSEKGKVVADIIENSSNEIFTSIVTLSEVISKVKRENKDYQAALDIIISLSKISELTLEIAFNTGIKHAEIKKRIKDFGLADAFVLQTSESLGAKILTGDPHFKSFKQVIML